MKLDLEAPTSEDIKDISKMISQGNPKFEQKKQKEVQNIVASKDEEITHLKNHSQDFVGARTLMVLKVGNSVELWDFVSGVTTQNSLRGVKVE